MYNIIPRVHCIRLSTIPIFPEVKSFTRNIHWAEMELLSLGAGIPSYLAIFCPFRRRKIENEEKISKLLSQVSGLFSVG